VPEIATDILAGQVARLEQAAANGETDEVVQRLLQIVPTFRDGTIAANQALAGIHGAVEVASLGAPSNRS
ncbi:MAG TPA: hypothetical protein VIH15_08605, partial [Casimicrobiaceae bacterium]